MNERGKLSTLAGKTYIGLVLLFLYAPILVMALMSFNASEYYTPPIHLTLDWYRKLANNADILQSSWRSIWIAVVTTILAVIIGTAAAISLFRHDFRGKTFLQAMLFPPIAIPWLIIGTAMLIFFFWIGIGRGSPAVILGHVALALPYVIVVVTARLKTFDIQLEEAARSLGANSWQITWNVTLPWISSGIVAAALFAFAVSFDQFVVSYFLAEPGDTTLPVMIYTAIRKGFTPEINAISTIIIILSMTVMLTASRYFKFGGER